MTYDLGQRSAAHAYGDHARQEIVDGAGENSAEHYPQEGCLTEHHSHYSAEDRTEACNVQKLYEKNLPCRHRQIVYVVAQPVGRHRPVSVGADQAVDECAVDEVAADEHRQSYEK